MDSNSVAGTNNLTPTDFQAIARLLTRVEHGMLRDSEWWADVRPRLGRAMVVGITGWPGVGKSTLVGRLLEHVIDNEYVGVVAVDPSSQLTGGAVLGDRLRMMSTVLRPNIFVRSLASHGDQSGVSGTTLGAVDVLDAFGFDWIFVETVGVGQAQVDILELADVIVLVTAPGLGDEVQAIKAGILEIPDLIIVNMADRPNAHRTMAGLRWALGHGPDSRKRIMSTVAIDDVGVEELWLQLREFREAVDSPKIVQRRRWRNRRRALLIATERLKEALILATNELPVKELLKAVEQQGEDPEWVARQLIIHTLEFLKEVR